MIDLITKKEFEDFLQMQDIISELIKVKTTELALIKYGRLPEGGEVDFDICESEFEPKCIFVEFITRICGDYERDQYNLPFEFLYDETYPEKYKMIYEERKRLLKEIKEQAEKERLERVKIGLESWEREQLKKLKQKYEDDIND